MYETCNTMDVITIDKILDENLYNYIGSVNF